MASGYNSPNYTNGEFTQLQLKGNHGRTPRIKTEVTLEYDTVAEEVTITPDLIDANYLRAGSHFRITDMNGIEARLDINPATPNDPLVLDVSGLAKATTTDGDWLVTMSLDSAVPDNYEATGVAKRINSGRSIAPTLFFDTTA
jgi:hypothetical protein